jgi:hypothetical protein
MHLTPLMKELLKFFGVIFALSLFNVARAAAKFNSNKDKQ